MRKEGYYRVLLKHENQWNVGFYDERFKTWHLVGSNVIYYEKEFRNINEEKIIMP